MFEAPPRHALGFSLRTDVKMPLAEMRLVVEQALGCRLRGRRLESDAILAGGDSRHANSLRRDARDCWAAHLPASWHHGEVPVRELAGYEGPDVVMINQVGDRSLEACGGGSWRRPDGRTKFGPRSCLVERRGQLSQGYGPRAVSIERDREVTQHRPTAAGWNPTSAGLTPRVAQFGAYWRAVVV